jgi:hypothetical protein
MRFTGPVPVVEPPKTLPSPPAPADVEADVCALTALVDGTLTSLEESGATWDGYRFEGAASVVGEELNRATSDLPVVELLGLSVFGLDIALLELATAPRVITVVSSRISVMLGGNRCASGAPFLTEAVATLSELFVVRADISVIRTYGVVCFFESVGNDAVGDSDPDEDGLPATARAPDSDEGDVCKSAGGMSVVLTLTSSELPSPAALNLVVRTSVRGGTKKMDC